MYIVQYNDKQPRKKKTAFYTSGKFDDAVVDSDGNVVVSDRIYSSTRKRRE